MSDLPEWCARVVETQLAYNAETWAALERHGVTQATPLSLDFFYNAPGQVEAHTLSRYLSEATDYHVEAAAQAPDGGPAQWRVSGTTRPTAVSLDILNQWVVWMAVAGADHGGCQFDGWGARVP